MKFIYPIISSLSLRLISFFPKLLDTFMDWNKIYFLHACLEAISIETFEADITHQKLKSPSFENIRCIFDAQLDNTFIWESLGHTYQVNLIFLTKLKLNKNCKKKRKKTSLKYQHKIFISLTCLNICILNVTSTIHVHNTKKK